jgi:hypothetical protein
MKATELEVKELLNRTIPNKTKIELRNAIANLTRQNIGGVYDERIANYRNQLAEKEATPCVTHNVLVKHSPLEVRAIMGFNSDRRFTITE